MDLMPSPTRIWVDYLSDVKTYHKFIYIIKA